MSSSTDNRISVARIGRPHGVAGAVTAVSLSDDPRRFRRGACFRTDENDPRELTLAEVRVRGEGLILLFSEVSNRNDADELRGHLLTIDARERRDLPEDEYWPSQLIGLRALTPGGRDLGLISDVVSGPAQDRLVVELTSGREVEIPFVEDLVPDISLADGTATIVPIDGLLS